MSGGELKRLAAHQAAARQATALALNRRQFLLIGGSTLLLSGCQMALPPATVQTPKTIAPQLPAQAYTIDDLLSTKPFYIAHRGSGDNWPEHTFEAYTKSIELGTKAIEVSVNATADGVFVCHHDKTTKRVSGGEDMVIAEVDWDALSGLTVDAGEWLGPAADTPPLSLLTDVLDAYAHTHVIFIEDKQGTNAVALLDLMDSYPDSTSHFVWKQWGGAGQYELAAARGYKTWGYFGPELFGKLDALVDRFDLLGITHTSTDDEISKIVSYGKPVICWEIHYRWMRDRMKSLGVAGLMCSNLPYVTEVEAPVLTDQFASGYRAAGDLPWTTDQGWSAQPAFDTTTASIRLANRDLQSYLMGSMCPIRSNSHRIQVELCWPESLPKIDDHAGVAFGAVNDSSYRVRVAGDVAGYHVIIRANGSLELFRRAAGVADGTSLGAVRTAAPKAGEWIRLEVDITPGTITVYRLDGVGWSFETEDASYRGGYFWLCKNYKAGPPVAFRTVRTLL